MGRLVLALVVALNLAGGAAAQVVSKTQPSPEIPSGFVMYRLQVSHPDATGTTLAESTSGGFSVRMPLPFNDFALVEPSGDVAHGCFLGGKTPAGIKISAVRVVYIKSAKIGDVITHVKSKPPIPGTISMVDTTFNGWPALDGVLRDRRSVAWTRWIAVGADAMTLTVEAPLKQEKAAQALVKPFFASLKVYGGCGKEAVS